MDPARVIAMALLAGLALWGLAVLAAWVDAWWRVRDNRAALERIDRELRRIMFRRCQLYRSNIGHERAMRRAADYVDGVAR